MSPKIFVADIAAANDGDLSVGNEDLLCIRLLMRPKSATMPSTRSERMATGLNIRTSMFG